MKKIFDKLSSVLIGVGSLVGMFYLVKLALQLGWLYLLALVALPLLACLVLNKRLSISGPAKRKEYLEFLLFVGAFFWIGFVGVHDKLNTYLQTNLVDGTIKHTMSWVEPDQGPSYQVPVEYFVADTEKGKRMANVLGWVLFGGVIVSAYVPIRLLLKTPEVKKTGGNKGPMYSNTDVSHEKAL